MQTLANTALLAVKNDQTSPNARDILSSSFTKICWNSLLNWFQACTTKFVNYIVEHMYTGRDPCKESNGGKKWKQTELLVEKECRRKQDNICLHLAHLQLSHAQVKALSHKVIKNKDSGDAKAYIKQAFPSGFNLGSKGDRMSSCSHHVTLWKSSSRADLLWVHVGPSQPSLQTQVKESPLTTQVPPLWQGFGRQLLFLAVTQTTFAAQLLESPQVWAKRNSWGQSCSAASASWRLCRVFTYVTSGSFPSRRTHALESVPLVIARPPVVARRLIALAVTCGKPKLSLIPVLSYGNKFKQPIRACLLCFGNAELTGVASFSFPPIFTFTEEVVDQVSASSSIVARVFTAVINIWIC